MKAKKKILVCDDEADLVAFLKLHLENAGYQIETAFDGKAGLKAVEDLRPDLLLLDINMPKMNGIEVYQRLTTSFGRTKIPVIIFTDREELGDLFRNIDADAFLPKPFKIATLLTQIEKILNRETEPTVFLMDSIDKPHARMIQKALTDERFQVVLIDDLKALKEKTVSSAPDFIIMEYMQKGTSGEKLITAIKQIPALAKVPLIVYAYSEPDGLEKKVMVLGASDYIGKPDRPQDIITAIKRLKLMTREPQN